MRLTLDLVCCPPDYTSTSDSEIESGEEYDPEQHRSPMNRAQADADVVCLGEVLPSAELQRRAESLMLPKHFYNFVKPGENVEDSAAETGDETGEKGGRLASGRL